MRDSDKLADQLALRVKRLQKRTVFEPEPEKPVPVEEKIQTDKPKDEINQYKELLERLPLSIKTPLIFLDIQNRNMKQESTPLIWLWKRTVTGLLKI